MRVRIGLAFLLLPLPLAAVVLPAGAEIAISVATSGVHQQPQVAAFPDGGFVVVWTVGPSTGGKTVVHARLLGADGKFQSGEFLLGTPVADSQVATAVATQRDGSFVVAWDQQPAAGPGRVYLRRFDRSGAALGHRVAIHPPDTLERRGARLAIRADGVLVVAWSALEVGPPSNPFPFLNTVARVLAPDGSPLGPEILVEKGDPGIGDNALDSSPGAIAFDPDGSFTIAYEDQATDVGRHAYLARFRIDGAALRLVPLGMNQLACEASSPALAVTSAGNAIASWEGFGCDGFAIQARTFSLRLRPLDAQRRVSRGPTGHQQQPAVAALADGRSVTVWDEPGRDGDGDGIFGRSFGADGAPQSPDFAVNLTTAGNQAHPAIAMSAGSVGLIAWDQRTADGATAIVARLLERR
jgi:hypothetical protein